MNILKNEVIDSMGVTKDTSMDDKADEWLDMDG